MSMLANCTKLPIAGKLKASTMMKAVEGYIRLCNNIWIKFIFDKCEVVSKRKTLILYWHNYQRTWSILGIDEEREQTKNN